ncbi:hypothetical protein D6D23_05874 [Aureobasidium pullulans]|nr:hypothetical protein D6D23_05874 [Aureobasidium pullulans]
MSKAQKARMHLTSHSKAFSSMPTSIQLHLRLHRMMEKTDQSQHYSGRYRSNHKSEVSPLIRPERAAHTTSKLHPEPQSSSSNTHSISPSTTQQPSNLRAWGKDDDTTAVVTFLRLALLSAYAKSTKLLRSSPMWWRRRLLLRLRRRGLLLLIEWSAPLITMTKKTKTVTETETQTVVQTGREAIDRMKRRRDRAARKTTVDTVYTPEVTMPMVRTLMLLSGP